MLNSFKPKLRPSTPSSWVGATYGIKTMLISNRGSIKKKSKINQGPVDYTQCSFLRFYIKFLKAIFLLVFILDNRIFPIYSTVCIKFGGLTPLRHTHRRTSVILDHEINKKNYVTILNLKSYALYRFKIQNVY